MERVLRLYDSKSEEGIYLEKMRKDSRLILKDFIPLHGELRYRERNSLHDVSNVGEERLEEVRKITDRVKNNNDILLNYNLGFICLGSLVGALWANEYFSKP